MRSARVMLSKWMSLAVLAVAIGCASTSRGVAAADQTTKPKETSCAKHISIDATDYDTTQVTEQPIIRTWPQMRYPEAALRNRITGRVVVAFVVSQVGVVDVSTVRTVSSTHPVLNAEAIAFVTGSTYWPGCLNGKAVRVRLAVPVDFKIR